MTLADEDTNSIPTDNANRAIQGNVATQVTQPGGHHPHLSNDPSGGDVDLGSEDEDDRQG